MGITKASVIQTKFDSRTMYLLSSIRCVKVTRPKKLRPYSRKLPEELKAAAQSAVSPWRRKHPFDRK